MEKKTMLVAEHIDKRFGMTHAVNDVSINIAAGEVRALIGENGSGKSTFCQMLCGIYSIGGGTFTLDGQPLHIRNQVEANDAGIAIIVQEMGTLSGLTVLCGVYAGGVEMTYGIQGDTSLNAAALGTVFGMKGGSIIIAVCLALFAFSTVLSWGMYGTRCCEFLLGPKSIKPYQIVFVIVVVVGATMDLSLAWDIADTLNGLMAIPNLIALVGLSGIVVKESKDYFENRIKNYE